MYFRTLPKEITSGENKGKQAFVQITNEKLGHPKDNPILVEQDRFEYPQFGPEPTKDDKGKEVDLTEEQAQAGIQEFIDNAGSALKALDVLNDVTKKAATTEGKNHIRLQEAGSVDDAVAAGLKRSHDFSWKSVERASNKEVVSAVKDLKSRIDTLSPEEQLAELKKIFNQI